MAIRYWTERWKRVLENLGVPGAKVVEKDGLWVKHPFSAAGVIVGEQLGLPDLRREVEAAPEETPLDFHHIRYVAAREQGDDWLVVMTPRAFKQLLDGHLFLSLFTTSHDKVAKLMGELGGKMQEEDGTLRIEVVLPTGHVFVLTGNDQEFVMAMGSITQRTLGVTPEFYKRVKEAFMKGKEAVDGKK